MDIAYNYPKGGQKMSQVLNMLWVVLIFWLVIEIVNNRISKNKRIVKFIDELNNEK
jgi:hypothetical protein